jgi:SAM-dependent methyltransferase
MLEAAAEAGYDITGLDISRVAVDQARARVPHAELRVGEAEDLPFAASTFDAVTCCGSLEHVTDPARAVQEMRRVARPGAPILVVVPNRHYLFSWVSYLRMKYLPGQSQPIERSATRAEWEALFAANGLRIRAVHQDDLFYFSTPFMKALAAGVRMVTPMRVCYQFVFVCEQDAHRA